MMKRLKQAFLILLFVFILFSIFHYLNKKEIPQPLPPIIEKIEQKKKTLKEVQEYEQDKIHNHIISSSDDDIACEWNSLLQEFNQSRK